MLKGIGNLYTKTLDLPGGAIAQRMTEHFPFTWALNETAEQLKAQGYSKGKRVTKSADEGTVETTLQMSMQYVNWEGLGFALGQYSRILTNEKIPLLRTQTVPLSGPFEIVDPDLSATDDAEIFVTMPDAGTWGQPGPMLRTATPTTSRQVSINRTAGKLTFAAAAAGAPISYIVTKAYSAIEAYGGAGIIDKRGAMEMWGLWESPEVTAGIPIWIPKLKKVGRPSFSFSGGIPELSMEFEVLTPAGWENAYKMYNLNTGVPA